MLLYDNSTQIKARRNKKTKNEYFFVILLVQWMAENVLG